MAKLTCKKHGRRVVVVPINDSPVTIHRSGRENQRCDSRTLTIAGRFVTPEDVVYNTFLFSPDLTRKTTS